MRNTGMMSFLLMHGIANPPIQMQMEVSLHPQLFTTRLLGVAGNDHPPLPCPALPTVCHELCVPERS